MYSADEQIVAEIIDALIAEGAYDHALTWIKDAIAVRVVACEIE